MAENDVEALALFIKYCEEEAVRLGSTGRYPLLANGERRTGEISAHWTHHRHGR